MRVWGSQLWHAMATKPLSIDSLTVLLAILVGVEIDASLDKDLHQNSATATTAATAPTATTTSFAGASTSAIMEDIIRTVGSKRILFPDLLGTVIELARSSQSSQSSQHSSGDRDHHSQHHVPPSPSSSSSSHLQSHLAVTLHVIKAWLEGRERAGNADALSALSAGE